MVSESNVDFSPGERVVLRTSGECGVIVHVWEALGGQDCYVAFFGKRFPATDQKPRRPPYVLRYFATSLIRASPKRRTRPSASARLLVGAKSGVRATRGW